MLAADRHGRTEEAGAGQEERGVDVEELEHGDPDGEPHHDGDEVVEHPGRRVVALPTTLLRDSAVSEATRDAPARHHLVCRSPRSTVGQPSNDAPHHEPGHAGHEQSTDQEGDDDESSRHVLQYGGPKPIVTVR